MKKALCLIIYVTIYVITSIVIAPFLGYHFGSEPTIIEKIICFFIEMPFRFLLQELSVGSFAAMLLFNGIFWGIISLKGVLFFRKIIGGRRKKID